MSSGYHNHINGITDCAFEFEVALEQAQKLIEQEQHSKNKLYSLHAPEVECISKGKAHKPYEFGVKASIAVTNKEGFVIGAQS